MINLLNKLFNEQKFFRRSILFWAISIITYVVYKIIDCNVLETISSPGASIVVAIIGILATVIGFYQYHRNKDDELAVKKEEQ